MARSLLCPRSFIAAGLVALIAFLTGCGGGPETGTAESVAALAGSPGGPGYFDGTGTFVRFSSPSGVAAIGTDLFVADTSNHVIRRIDTATGAVTTLAGVFGASGTTDGTGAAARFDTPAGITAVGTILFVCDTGNHTIRRIVSTSGAVTTLAGTPGTAGAVDNVSSPGVSASFSSPRGIAPDPAGSALLVADTGNHKIRRVTLTGTTSTFAGSGVPGADNGVGTAAAFSSPEGVAATSIGDIFVADTGNHTIRKIVSLGAVGDVSTIAGAPGSSGFTDNQAGSLARFFSPSSIAAIGTDLFVADTRNHTIRKIDASSFVTTLAGNQTSPGFSNGTGSAALFNGPKGIGTNGSALFVADTENHSIRQVTAGGAVTTPAGNPPQAGTADATGTAARFRGPAGAVAVGDNVMIADTGNHTIRKVTAAGVVTTLAGSPGVSGILDGIGTAARFTSPQGIAAVGTDLYVADSGNNAIRKVTSAGTVTTFAGSATGLSGFDNGVGTAARFNNPRGVATDGTSLFVADTGNHAIRKIDIATGTVSTLAGTGAAGSANSPAQFSSPEGVAFLGTNVYVADTGNHTIRRVANPSGSTVTFAGTAGASGFADGPGASALFTSPRGIAAVGSFLYLADTGNHAVRRISTAATVIAFVGASASATTRDGAAGQALLNTPAGITGVTGTIFFTDANENVVRKILF